MCPEIVQRKPYSGEKADVWALGVVLYVTLSGKFPFVGKKEKYSILKAKMMMNYINKSSDAQLKFPVFLETE